MARCYYSWAWKYLPAFLELVDQSISPGHGQRRPRTLGQVPSCWNAIKLPWFGESQVQVHQERTWPFPSFLFLFFPFFFFFFELIFTMYNYSLCILGFLAVWSLFLWASSFFFFFSCSLVAKIHCPGLEVLNTLTLPEHLSICLTSDMWDPRWGQRST